MNVVNLIAKRQAITRKAPSIGQIMKGSVVIVKRYCGKPNCRCRKGYKHRSMYVSQTIGGKSRLVYIPARSEESVRRLIANHTRLKAALQKISNANTSLATRSV